MKGIKLFFGVLAAASLLFSVNAFAQENANRDENGKFVRGAYETNKAFDNIFIGIAGGYNTTAQFGNKGAVPTLIAKGGLAVDAYIGKWWTPFLGARIGYHGLSTDVSGQKFGDQAQHIIPFDLLWSLTNTFGGYKETRLWDISLYGTGAFAMVNVKGSLDNEWMLGAGLLNEFRLGKRVDLMLDIRGLVAKASTYDLPQTGSNVAKFAFPLSATLGLSFNLGKTNFDRHSSITPVVIPVPFTTEQYNALKERVEALEKENAELKDQVAELQKIADKVNNLVDGQTYLYKDGEFTAVEVVKASPLTLYFDCGQTKLNKRELAHLDYFNQNVVDGDVKLDVNGYADKQTGSKKRNQYLSEQRVKYVTDLLVKAGAKEDNISGAAHGCEVQLFDGAANNRVVTIEVK
ncbi:MAG: OmpA family protein [Bacteroidales bacterium]|nr:OmpA family protein [Bacteroidales bacterium]